MNEFRNKAQQQHWAIEHWTGSKQAPWPWTFLWTRNLLFLIFFFIYILVKKIALNCSNELLKKISLLNISFSRNDLLPQFVIFYNEISNELKKEGEEKFNVISA